MLYKGLIFLTIFLAPTTSLYAVDLPIQTKPNIIFILSDDTGFADLGCYGHPYAKTPNLDKLAAEGTRFRQFYATGVTCCPARTGLMTSKWPASYATYPANGGFKEQTTITELLKKNGYATGHFGKWHIGPNQKAGTYGIDVTSADNESGGKKKQSLVGRDAPIFDEAIKFMEQQKNKPFYINIWGHISHHPISPPASYIEKFKTVTIDELKFAAPMREKFAACKSNGGDVNEHMRRYLADINSMDEDIGRLLNRLDKLGLRDNTIIVFSSDQGPAPLHTSTEKNPDVRRLDAMGYAGEFRGGKHGMYEGGVRVPFIVRWPNQVPANRIDEKSILSGADWLPTLCTITGIKINPMVLDGEDSSSAWFGNKDFVRAKPLFWKTSAPGSEAGIRDGQWKLIQPTRKRGEIELYDINRDPSESKNVASQNAEVATRLSAKVKAWVATLPKEYIKTKDGDK